MRRVALALFSTVTGLVMLLSFKTHGSSTAGTPAAVSDTGPVAAGNDSGSTASSASSASASSSASSSSGSSSSGAASSNTTKTVTGDSVDTRWGPVQVQITVTNGKITAANAVVYPQNNGRDVQINSYAIPQLQQETLAASSAQIDMVSGATYTSEGYIGSLQSALDKL
jgi:uncharacterized protein with FMN-binding domain